VRPYTLEVIEAIVGKESIPIGLGIAPTETEESADRLYKHAAEILGEEAEVCLRSIPLLSEQGTALWAFALKSNLRWFCCLRHRIQNAGPFSIGGDWMRRLLEAVT
jgi:hypothetical protein